MFACWPVLQAHHASRLTQGPPRWAWDMLTCHSVFPSQKTLQHRLAFMLNLLWLFPKNLVTLPRHRDLPESRGQDPEGRPQGFFAPGKTSALRGRAREVCLRSKFLPPRGAGRATALGQGQGQLWVRARVSSGPGPGSALREKALPFFPAI